MYYNSRRHEQNWTLNNVEPNDELLSAFLDDELSDRERAQVEKRLESDGSYRRRYEDYRALREAVQKLPRHRLGDGFAQQIVERIEVTKSAGDPATAQPTTGQPTISKKSAAPRHFVRHVLPWAVSALAASVVFALFIPALREPKDRLARGLNDSAGRTVHPADGTPMPAEEAAPAPVGLAVESTGDDRQRAAVKPYRVDVFDAGGDERKLDLKVAGEVVDEEVQEKGEVKLNETYFKEMEGLAETDELAKKAQPAASGSSLEDVDFVIATASIDNARLRTVLARHAIAAAKDLAREERGRLRKNGQPLETMIKQDAASALEYVLVEASPQRIDAVLQDLNQSGTRYEFLPRTSESGASPVPALNALEFSDQVPSAGRRADTASRARRLTQREFRTQSGAVVNRALPSTDRDKTSEPEAAPSSETTLEGSKTLTADGPANRQPNERFGLPRGAPVEEHLWMETVPQRLRESNEGTDPVRVLFVIRTTPFEAEIENSSSASPAQPAPQ